MSNILARVSSMSRHPLARGSFVVLVGTTLANVASYAYHLVIGRILGPVGYGELASLFSFLYLLNVPSLVLQTVMTRYVSHFRAAAELGKAKSLSITILKVLCMVLVVGFIILLPFVGWLAAFLRINRPAAVVFTYLTAALWILGIVQVSLLQGLQRFSVAMVLSNVGMYLRLIGGAVGAMIGVTETVIAGVITSAIGFGLHYVPLRDVYGAKLEKTNISRDDIVSYSVPSLITMLGITSLYSTDIMLAKHFLSPLEAGYYAAISVMGKIIYFASSSVSYVLFPVVAERAKRKAGSRKLIYSGTLVVALVSLGITAGYFLLPKFALFTLFGASYFPASGYLGWFGLFMSFFSVSYVLSTALLGLGETRVSAIVMAASLLQIIGIFIYHESIYSIISVNLAISFMLTAGLLIYYRHAVKDS